MTKLTFDIIIIFKRRSYWYWSYVPSFFLNLFHLSLMFHHLLKWFWLLFPFWNILLIFNWNSILFRYFLWWFCFWFCLNLLNLVWQSMLCNFKDLTLFISFLTCIFMFFYSIRSKFSSALTTWHPCIFIDFNWTFIRLFDWRSLSDFLFFLYSLSV